MATYDPKRKQEAELSDLNRQVQRKREEVLRLRTLLQSYRHMLRYDWIETQDRNIKELQQENDKLREVLRAWVDCTDSRNDALHRGRARAALGEPEWER